MERPEAPIKKKKTGRNIAIIVIVLAVAAVFIYEILPPSSNQLSVQVKSVTVDHADEVLIGHTAKTAYILNVALTYSGSGSINVNPSEFNIVTSGGTYQADSSGYISTVTNPLDSVSVSAGQTASGQIYISLADGTTINSVYYSYDGLQYKSNVPSANSWISWVEGVNVTLNGQPVSFSSNPYLYSVTFTLGDETSGSAFTVNISITNNNLLFSQTISGATVNSPFSISSTTPTLSTTVAAGQTIYLNIGIQAPSQSYYGYVVVNISTS